MAFQVKAFNRDAVTDRLLYLVTLDTPDDPITVEIPADGFVCLLAWDACGY